MTGLSGYVVYPGVFRGLAPDPFFLGGRNHKWVISIRNRTPDTKKLSLSYTQEDPVISIKGINKRLLIMIKGMSSLHIHGASFAKLQFLSAS